MEDSVTTPPDAVAAAMKLTPLMCRFPCSTRQKAVPFISHSLAHLWSTPEVNRKQFRGPLEHRKLLIIQVMLVDVKMANRPVKIAVIVHERQAVIRAHYPWYLWLDNRSSRVVLAVRKAPSRMTN